MESRISIKQRERLRLRGPRRNTEWTGLEAPGAFKRSLKTKTPSLEFEHGQHASIGTMSLGKFDLIREDRRGLYVEADLLDKIVRWHAARSTNFRLAKGVSGLTLVLTKASVATVPRRLRVRRTSNGSALSSSSLGDSDEFKAADRSPVSVYRVHELIRSTFGVTVRYEWIRHNVADQARLGQTRLCPPVLLCQPRSDGCPMSSRSWPSTASTAAPTVGANRSGPKR
jgi:hypothetical protein